MDQPQPTLPVDSLLSLASSRTVKMEELVRACRLYCEQDLKMKEIAKKLGCSAGKVTKLIQLAHHIGLLRTTVHPPEDLALSARLVESLQHAEVSLRSVIVAVGRYGSVGQYAAHHFERSGRSGCTVVLDGGQTVADFVASLAQDRFRNMTLVPISADPPSYDASAYELVTRMAMKLPTGVRCAKLPHFRGKRLEAVHQGVQARASQADFVFLGAGPWKKRFTALDFVYHLGLEPSTIRARYPHVACACGYHALDNDGREVAMPEIDQLMPRALTFEALQERARSPVCQVVLLAASRKKAKTVQVVLRARLCNTLIVDEELAVDLIKRIGKGQRSAG